jgi:3-oxoacyl-[acyl-carrier protein] reductase
MPLVLVTGGASLIGEAVARSLNDRGWTVLLTDIDRDGVDKVRGELPQPANAAVERMDVTNQDEIANVVALALSRHGAVDALVNVAGGFRGLGIPRRDFVDFTSAERDRIIEVNVKGVFNCCHAVLPHMIAAKRGGIVSITAARGLRGGAKASIYSAAKAAIIVFSQSLAQEVGPHGVRVNTVAPGNTAARWKNSVMEESRSPLGRPTSPEDVGEAVAFLLSQAASHITGSCIDVSGGTALH